MKMIPQKKPLKIATQALLIITASALILSCGSSSSSKNGSSEPNSPEPNSPEATPTDPSTGTRQFGNVILSNMGEVNTEGAESEERVSNARSVASSGDSPVITITVEINENYNADTNDDYYLYYLNIGGETINITDVIYVDPHHEDFDADNVELLSVGGYFQEQLESSKFIGVGGLFGVYEDENGALNAYAISFHDPDFTHSYNSDDEEGLGFAHLDRQDNELGVNQASWTYEGVDYGYFVLDGGEIVDVHLPQGNWSDGTITFNGDVWAAELGDVDLVGTLDGTNVSGQASYNNGQMVGEFQGTDYLFTYSEGGEYVETDANIPETGGAFAGSDSGDGAFVGGWYGSNILDEDGNP